MFDTNDLYIVGESVRLNDDYSWGNGRWAGQVVQITDVHDHRDLADDPEALIYGAQFVDSRDGSVMVTGIPVSPSDIDESYDHYEAQRASDWNGFLNVVMACRHTRTECPTTDKPRFFVNAMHKDVPGVGQMVDYWRVVDRTTGMRADGTARYETRERAQQWCDSLSAGLAL